MGNARRLLNQAFEPWAPDVVVVELLDDDARQGEYALLDVGEVGALSLWFLEFRLRADSRIVFISIELIQRGIIRIPTLLDRSLPLCAFLEYTHGFWTVFGIGFERSSEDHHTEALLRTPGSSISQSKPGTPKASFRRV